MVFNSYQYILFLVVVVCIYWSLRQVRHQNALLLVAGYVFYGSWDWRFLALILFSTLVDYFVGKTLVKLSGRRRFNLLLISLAVNFGILGFFKYFNFFVDS